MSGTEWLEHSMGSCDVACGSHNWVLRGHEGGGGLSGGDYVPSGGGAARRGVVLAPKTLKYCRGYASGATIVLPAPLDALSGGFL